MSLELTTRASVKHLNLRKEGPQDQQALAVDMKLACVTDAGVLAFFHPTLRSLLFNDTGSPRIPQLEPIAIDGELKNMDLDIAAIKVLRAELKKFVFEPLSGARVAMTFSASFEPTRAQLVDLADLIGREVPLEVKPEGALDLGLPPVARVAGTISGATAMVNVDLNVNCDECGKPGATDSRICLRCISKATKGKPMKSAAGRAVQERIAKL